MRAVADLLARARALAARAVDAAATSHEAETSARTLAKLIHEHPEILAPTDPPPQLNPSVPSEVDAIVGSVVREGLTELFSMMQRRAARGPAPAPSFPCPVCGAPGTRGYLSVRNVWRCPNGHRFLVRKAAAPKAAPKKRAKK